METEPLALVPSASLAYYRQATDVANVCRDIVVATAVEIQGRKYVKVEGWTSIAVAHGCIATIKDGSVQEVFRDGKLIGIRAVAELRRMPGNDFLSSAEGFVGVDEPDWFGSHGLQIPRWNKQKRIEEMKVVEKRADFAIRAMAQTRGISRVCRTGFSHVVVLIDKGLSTVPYEEVAPAEETGGDAGIHGKIDAAQEAAKTAGAAKTETGAAGGGTKTVEVPRDATLALREQFRGRKWEKVVVHFGADKDKTLGEMAEKKLGWWMNTWSPKAFGNKPIPEADLLLRAALDVALEETAAAK